MPGLGTARKRNEKFLQVSSWKSLRERRAGRKEKNDEQGESDQETTQSSHSSQEPLHRLPSWSSVLLKDSGYDGSESRTHWEEDSAKRDEGKGSVNFGVETR